MQKIHAMIHRFHNPDLGILLVRVALGLVFIHSGWLKIMNMDMALAGFASMGFSAGIAYFVTYAEFIGGILLIAGFLVRYVGIILAVIMAVATLKVHLPNGYGMTNGLLEGGAGGYEYTLGLFLLSLAMVTFGAGAYSLARMMRR
jgi:putative oxidoreductase